MIARINNAYLPGMLDELFRNDLSDRLYTGRQHLCAPAVNIIEEEKAFQIELAAPGMKRDDFRLDLDNEVLTISSEKKEQEEKGPRYLKREFGVQAFKKSFSLPDSVNSDAISAVYTDGILRITLPLKEEEVKKGPKSIEIA